MSAVSDELNSMVSMFDALLADMDDLLRRANPEDLDVADALTCRVVLGSASLALVRERLDNLLGDALGTYETTVPGIGVVRRHKRKARTKWDKDLLMRDVADSRVFARDGTMKDESPLDKVLHVWNLGAPRTTALKERSLDADNYCAVEERPGWTIETK